MPCSVHSRAQPSGLHRSVPATVTAEGSMDPSVPPGGGRPHRYALPIPSAAPAYLYDVTMPTRQAVNAAAGRGVLDVLSSHMELTR